MCRVGLPPAVFSFLLDLHSHFPRSKFQFENRASLFMLFRASLPPASSRDSGTVRTPLTCVTVVAFRFSGLIAFFASREATVILLRQFLFCDFFAVSFRWGSSSRLRLGESS